MARIYQKLSQIDSAQQYLVELGTLTELCDDMNMSADVAVLLAHFHVTQSQDYQQALDFAENGFHLTLRHEDSTNTISTSSSSSESRKPQGSKQLKENVLRVWCGVAKGCALQSTLIPTIVQADHDEVAMGALLNWRSLNIPLPPVDREQFLDKTNFELILFSLR
ncbi:unnamed protein product [Echinostoma caproni]|uniref:Nuclear pore complex protein n=1 Tax=Echinostoma caproni TaxID=27848 RepID=A0A183AHB8_9TREM|nr:unnamed protein product [Echinostoma caproni]